MLKALLNLMIARMERQRRYDAGYAHRITDVSPWTSLKFAVVTGLVDRRAAPAEALAAVAAALGRSEAACRQLAARARTHVREAKPRFAPSKEDLLRLAAAFMEAARTGDTATLAEMLAEDAVLVTDGGGKRSAALRPIVGRAEVVALIEALGSRGGLAVAGEVRVVRINGAPGLIVPAPDGPQTVTFDTDASGRISAIFIVRNPDKLGRLPT